MKFLPDATQATSVTGYGPGWVSVNGEKITASVVISATGDRFAWECAQFSDLQASHFDRLATMDIELVIFGSGDKMQFPHPAMLQSLFNKRIGVETMDTHAACRTYNFLAGEGRKVAAALLL